MDANDNQSDIVVLRWRLGGNQVMGNVDDRSFHIVRIKAFKNILKWEI